MSSQYLLDFSKFVSENFVNYEVEHALNEIVETVEIMDYNDKLETYKAKLDEALWSKSKLEEEVAVLKKEKDSLLAEKFDVKAKALKVRNIFVSDIGSVLNEGRSVVKLKSKIRGLEDKVAHMEQLEADLEDSQQKLKAIEKAYYLTQSAKETGDNAAVSLTTIEDQLLLNVFAFLQTEDVLSAAQVNRLLFARVDNLFSIGSELIQPEWLEGADVGSGPVDEAETAGGALLTQQMADQLAQKLSAPELKVIVSMKEELNNQEGTIQKMNTQTEDLNAKVENTERVRDFLIEKLKAAEMAIKTFMKDNAELKVQASADKEVISFLDLHRLEIDSVNRDLLSKNEALKASVDVLTSLNAQTEKQYGMEITELKDRLVMAEKEHKSQKKMLAKEVKMLRGLLLSNTEELERHRSHLDHLRKSLDIVGISNAAPYPQQNHSKSSRLTTHSNSSGTNPFA